MEKATEADFEECKRDCLSNLTMYPFNFLGEIIQSASTKRENIRITTSNLVIKSISGENKSLVILSTIALSMLALLVIMLQTKPALA